MVNRWKKSSSAKRRSEEPRASFGGALAQPSVLLGSARFAPLQRQKPAMFAQMPLSVYRHFTGAVCTTSSDGRFMGAFSLASRLSNSSDIVRPRASGAALHPTQFVRHEPSLPLVIRANERGVRSGPTELTASQTAGLGPRAGVASRLNYPPDRRWQ
jgi:hypothetical protein